MKFRSNLIKFSQNYTIITYKRIFTFYKIWQTMNTIMEYSLNGERLKCGKQNLLFQTKTTHIFNVLATYFNSVDRQH